VTRFKPTRLRPSQGGTFHPPVGKKQERILQRHCEKCGYVICSCLYVGQIEEVKTFPKHLNEEEVAQIEAEAKRSARKPRPRKLSAEECAEKVFDLAGPPREINLNVVRMWSKGNHRKAILIINNRVMGRWYVKTDTYSKPVGYIALPGRAALGGTYHKTLADFVDDCIDAAETMGWL
jgi:hypothetical protein